MERDTRREWLFVAGAFALFYGFAFSQAASFLDALHLNEALEWVVVIVSASAAAFWLVRNALRRGAPRQVWLGAPIQVAAAMFTFALIYFVGQPLLAWFLETRGETPLPYPLLSHPGYMIGYVLEHVSVIVAAYMASRSPLPTQPDLPAKPPRRRLLVWSGVILAGWVAYLVLVVLTTRWFMSI